MKKTLSIAILLAAAVFASVLFLGAEYRLGKGGRTPEATHKITGVPVSTMININSVAAWYEANGEQERDPSNGNSGLWFPRGTSTAIYSAGILYGGLFNDGVTPTIRMNGQSYNNGTKPGAILGLRTGVAEDPNNADVRIWRIRKDYYTADLTRDAAEVLNKGALSTVTSAQVQEIRDQYAKDWAEWPWQKGAPFYDVGYLAANGVDIVGANNGVLDWGEDLNRNGILDPAEDANGNGALDGEKPGVASADQVIWYVCNDLGVAQPWSCPPSGIEEQATIWGYNRTDPIANVIFKKFRIIYKGTGTTPINANITNMYLMQWADPDLGDSGDDFAGCDTVLSMCFVYNGKPVDANYAQFGLAPPASGYDFLQGPLVTGVAGEDLNKNGIDDAADYAIWDLKRVGPGKINLPMTSAMYFAANGHYSDPPFSYSGAIQFYQMLRGMPPTPQGPPDPPMLDYPVGSGRFTPYWLSGDPVAGTGWLDGVIDQPGDRRICLSSGPFSMSLGDTQELVSAWVGGLGSSAIQSVAVMKYNDKFVQTAYDSLFRLSGPPENARVDAYGINNRIILDWGWDSAAVARTEQVVVIGNYQFQGYKLYQFPNGAGDLASAIPLGQWDIVDGVKVIKQDVKDPRSGEVILTPVQIGTDNGIIRALSLSTDIIRGTPFITGTRYYFAVTAYNYCPDAANPVKTYESSPVIVTVLPETPKPGTRYAYTAGDTVHVRDLVGRNDAPVNPVIYSPSRQTGMSYQLVFDTTAAGAFRWSLNNTGTGKVLFQNITDLAGTTPYPVTESGFSLTVASPPLGVRDIVNEKGGNVYGLNSSDPNYDVVTSGGAITDLQGLNVKTGTRYQIRFDGVGSYAVRNGIPPSVQAGPYKVPFSVWDIGRMDVDTPRQVIAWVKWDKVAATRDVWSIDTAKVTIGGTRYSVFEAITITSVPYPAIPGDSAALYTIRATINPIGTTSTDARAAVYQLLIRDKTGTDAYPPQGTQITINKYLKLKAGDVKGISPNANTVNNADLARSDVTAIKAFPNPYYGLNRQETDQSNRFVTFNHLPKVAILRIFNLAGVLVRRIDKNDASTQFQRWDLQNQNGLPVASGIYIVYIDMPELGVTRTLKVAIIQEQQFLRNF